MKQKESSMVFPPDLDSTRQKAATIPSPHFNNHGILPLQQKKNFMLRQQIEHWVSSLPEKLPKGKRIANLQKEQNLSGSHTTNLHRKSS